MRHKFIQIGVIWSPIWTEKAPHSRSFFLCFNDHERLEWNLNGAEKLKQTG